MAELLNNTKGSKTEIHWILFDIQRERKEFQHVQFSFIPRTCNAYAHALAKFALKNSPINVWVDTISAKVQNVINCVFLYEIKNLLFIKKNTSVKVQIYLYNFQKQWESTKFDSNLNSIGPRAPGGPVYHCICA